MGTICQNPIRMQPTAIGIPGQETPGKNGKISFNGMKRAKAQSSGMTPVIANAEKLPLTGKHPNFALLANLYPGIVSSRVVLCLQHNPEHANADTDN